MGNNCCVREESKIQLVKEEKTLELDKYDK